MPLCPVTHEQVVLRFPSVFWDDAVDYFGAAPAGGPAARGRCSTFWNLHRWGGQPILAGLLSGLSADQARSAFCLWFPPEGPILALHINMLSHPDCLLQLGCQQAHAINQA